MNLRRRLSELERDELESLMNVRDPGLAGPMGASITRLHGFLTSVISGPLVLPSEWVSVVFGGADDPSAWETMEQAQRATELLMRFNNEISTYLERGQYTILIDRIGEEPDTVDMADDWCRGYLFGVGMRQAEWTEALESDADLDAALLPILTLADVDDEPAIDPIANTGEYAEIRNLLPQCALDIYDWWRAKLAGFTAPVSHAPIRREAPKISPNAPCPCGSGKKYKRCCSPLRVV